MKKIIALFLVIGTFNSLHAQKHIPCQTDENLKAMQAEDPSLIQAQIDAEKHLRTIKFSAEKAGTVKYIPVVFHVIHKWGTENISQAQIQDAIRALNDDYRKVAGTNGAKSSDPLAVDMQYEFRLAQFDPTGKPTNGVNRVYSLLTDNARDNAKALSYWDSKKYYNVWVVNTIQNTFGSSGIVLGYAQFPYMLSRKPSTDGVVMCANQVGTIEVGATDDQLGRTFTHETGHWTGLYHTFQDGCVGLTPSTCDVEGDLVCDTPPLADASFGCQTTRESCNAGILAMVKNYMDYSDGSCMELYTVGQKNRSDVSMNAYRSVIYSTSNLNAAGLNADGTYIPLISSTLKAPYTCGFNLGDFANDGWKYENYTSPGDSGWRESSKAAYEGTGAMCARNVLHARLGNYKNAFVSPSIDISSLASPSLTFQVAYAKRIGASNDKLRVYISNNFGRTEELLATYAPADMVTGLTSTTEFVPSVDEWKLLKLDLSAYKSFNNCQIRFELGSLRGNNIYIDNFSIAELTTGVGSIYANQFNLELYPNPAKSSISVKLNQTLTAPIEYAIYAIDGAKVASYQQESNQINQQLDLNIEALQSGVYLLQVKTSKGTIQRKFIKN
jgi:hypothetical protein